MPRGFDGSARGVRLKYLTCGCENVVPSLPSRYIAGTYQADHSVVEIARGGSKK